MNVKLCLKDRVAAHINERFCHIPEEAEKIISMSNDMLTNTTILTRLVLSKYVVDKDLDKEINSKQC